MVFPKVLAVNPVLGHLSFIININDIYNSTDFGKIVLFADDTNILVADGCKIKVFKKANTVIESINYYMKCNLLHIYINIIKCCYYMHFTSNQKEVTADDEKLNLVLGQNFIKCVKTKRDQISRSLH